MTDPVNDADSADKQEAMRRAARRASAAKRVEEAEQKDRDAVTRAVLTEAAVSAFVGRGVRLDKLIAKDDGGAKTASDYRAKRARREKLKQKNASEPASADDAPDATDATPSEAPSATNAAFAELQAKNASAGKSLRDRRAEVDAQRPRRHPLLKVAAVFGVLMSFGLIMAPFRDPRMFGAGWALAGLVVLGLCLFALKKLR